ncbi:Vacuolar fusion protein CCZ1 homolog [Geodia barretti]|nr:Vacuolar fusion protein CCZ1 homolog [Geodia barretti]
MATSYVKESELLSFFVYDTRLGLKEGTEEQKILYYHPDNESVNKKVRNVGLCEALVNFTKTFNPDRPCQAVHTDRKRQVFLEPEPEIWTVMTVSIPWVEQVNNGERTVQYIQDYVQDEVLETALQRSYSMFKLFHGSYTDVCNQAGQEGLRARLQRFYSRYLQTIDVDKLDIFSIFQGMQFLPLDKYMYLKAHCFVNLVETTYRNIQRTVFLYGDQLVW